MRACLVALLCLFLLPVAAAAQQADRPNTILVLDASGSMWGQIDGVNKIVIARDVVAGMLDDMPDDTSLGLTVYGHRERGSCSDIETIVAPAPGTRGAILEAVNAINPRGRTPMADAVIAAAQSLRHTENPATVILVSDGIENCNPDPCAAARELEASGIGFTAHVIGFDVAAEPEARAQMQCIAEGTGGMFLTADNADELSSALQRVVEAPTPETVQIAARVTPGDVPPTRPVTWTLLAPDGTVLSDGTAGPAITAQLMPGSYVARATRAEPGGPAAYQTAFTVVEGMATPVTVPMPEIVETVPVTFMARVEPDMTVPASALNWTLRDAAGTVLLGPVEAPGGNVRLLPGDYSLTVERLNRGTTHEASFTVSAGQPREVVIPLPALVVDVTLSARIGGPDGPVIDDPVLWEIEGLEATMDSANPYTLGLARGAYRVTAYWTVQEVARSADFVVVDQPREIAVVFDEPVPQASVTAPASAVAGDTVEVGWSGPEEEHDFVAIRAPDAEGYHRFANSTRVTEGNPLPLLMPSQPGDYVVEYIRSEGRTALAATPITVTPAEASVTAPATAAAGETIEVGWTGPDYDHDFIAVRAPDSEGHHRFANTVGTDRGNPARLTMPSTPGTYVIEYIEAQDRSPLAAVSIEVTEVAASLTAPATASVGDEIEIGWTGPDYDNDFIAIRAPDAEGHHRFSATVGTDRGNPARLQVPAEPGRYVIEYIEGQDRTPLAVSEITVSEAEAALTAPASAVAGSTVEVGWTGPDADGDFVGIGAVDAEGGARWERYVYTREGSPVRLEMPGAAGDYVIRYFLGQGATVLTSAPITVTPVEASLTVPESAEAGSTIEVGWTGPGYDGDFVGIGAAGAEGGARWQNYTHTRDGNPLRLTVPAQPGPHVVRYFLDRDNTVVATATLEVTPASASLTAPATAEAGKTLEVGWTGPGNDGDFVAIGPAGAEGGARWQAYRYTRDGNPAQLSLPDAPGAYVLRYFLDEDNTPIAEVPITLE